MFSPQSWDYKELWSKHGRDCAVEISRHSGLAVDGEGPNRWAVYAYIYPSHPHFREFSGDSIFQPAATAMPLHRGPSLLKRHVDETGNVTSIQVGADYHHLRDTHYTFVSELVEGDEIWRDSEVLLEWLNAKNPVKEAQSV